MSATATGAGTADTSQATPPATAQTATPAATGAPATAPPATAAPPASGTGLAIPVTPPVTLPSEALIAGKFKTQADLATGYTNLADKLGLKGIVRDTFEKPEDHVAAYKALEAKLGAAAPVKAPEPTRVDTGIATPPVEPPKNVADVVTRAGLKTDEITAAFKKDGKLSDEQYATLVKVAPGFLSREMIDQFIGGHLVNVQQIQARAQAHAVQIAGGPQQLQTLLSYADALPESVKNDLQSRLNDPGRYEGALLEIQERFRQAARTGGSQNLIHGTGTSGATVYASNAEMHADMNHPMYGKDANFTAAARAKFQRSIRAGTVNPSRIV